jgi:hypothetical protein
LLFVSHFSYLSLTYILHNMPVLPIRGKSRA